MKFNPPSKPGVYLYKNKFGKIIYIGKAKNLKKRVGSYFNRVHENEKTNQLVKNIDTAEFIVTNNEVEALILEGNLIRMHKPKYNIDLKNNIRHAYIQITKEEFARMIIARKKNKTDTFFGPIPIGYGRGQVIDILRRIFKIRNCKTLPKKVCLQYHLNQCSAPCEKLISKHDYSRDVKDAVRFLKGDKKGVIEDFTNLMNDFAKDKNFEMAKLYRDRIRALQTIDLNQIVESSTKYDSDFINFYQTTQSFYISVISMNKGIIIKKTDFALDNLPGVFENFLIDFYSKNTIPGLICLPKEALDLGIDCDTYGEVFTKKSAHKVEVKIPQKGEKLKLIELAKENVLLQIRGQNKILLELQKELKLKTYPKVIDCFDMSTIQGTTNVGAVVRFVNAVPHRSAFRKFIIKSLAENEQNDFAAMFEVVQRRYARLKNELAVGKSGYEHDMPDLIIIDGGRQQLNKALEALKSLDLKLPIIGLAKREEEIYFPGLPNPINPKNDLPFMRLLTRIRDEVHHYVINFHRQRRDKKLTNSELNQINGIGDLTILKLFNAFGSMSKIKVASLKELEKIVNKKQSKLIYDYFHKK